MPVSSMTGFARTGGAHGELRWHWEIRSVNGKNLDLRCRLPQGYESLEAGVKAAAAAKFKRGNMQAVLDLPEHVLAGQVTINEALLDQLASAAARLAQKYGGGPPRIDQLLGLRGVVELVDDESDDETRATRDAAILASFQSCAEALQRARQDEGSRLASVIAAQVNRIAGLVVAARDCPARTPEAIRRRIGDQVARLAGTDAAVDPARLHQEALLIAVRADIQEELDRLFAHVEAAKALLASGDSIGRKFDFLSQEFNREANTLCSKSVDPAITAIGLELKSVIDQMREQVQNIE
jgi:uncharacterized protein (TIGR00255 family)